MFQFAAGYVPQTDSNETTILLQCLILSYFEFELFQCYFMLFMLSAEIDHHSTGQP